MKNQINHKLVSLVFGVLVFCFALGFYAYAWTGPAVSPPEGNIATPLNVSSVGQSKIGGLILNTGGIEYGLIIDKGKLGLRPAGAVVNTYLDVDGGGNLTFTDIITGTKTLAELAAGGGGGGGCTCGIIPNQGLKKDGDNFGLSVCGDGKILKMAAGKWECRDDDTGGVGGGAPINVGYLVMGLNDTLTGERKLTSGSGVSIADGGPNGNVTFSADTAYLQRNVGLDCSAGQYAYGVDESGNLRCRADLLGGGGGGGYWNQSGNNVYPTNSSWNIKWGSKRGTLSNDQGASIELGGSGNPYIDFSQNMGGDYGVRLQLDGNDRLRVYGGDLNLDNSFGIYAGRGGINGDFNVGRLCLNGTCKSSWPSGGISSCSVCDGRFVNQSGDTMSGNFRVNNGNINTDGSHGVYTGTASINNDLYVGGRICFGGDCRGSWDGGGGSGSLVCTRKHSNSQVGWNVVNLETSVWCDNGYVAVGGGAYSGSTCSAVSFSSYPGSDNRKWTCQARNEGCGVTGYTCWVRCCKVQ